MTGALPQTEQDSIDLVAIVRGRTFTEEHPGRTLVRARLGGDLPPNPEAD